MIDEPLSQRKFAFFYFGVRGVPKNLKILSVVSHKILIKLGVLPPPLCDGGKNSFFTKFWTKLLAKYLNLGGTPNLKVVKIRIC